MFDDDEPFCHTIHNEESDDVDDLDVVSVIKFGINIDSSTTLVDSSQITSD